MKVDMVLVAAELKRIADASGGVLYLEAVLSTASDKTNPMFGWFNWNNDTAGHSWRLEQARQLIKAVYVTVKFEAAATDLVVPRYVSEENGQGGGRHYVDVIAVMSDEERRRELVTTTIGRAIAILRNCPEVICQGLASHLEKALAKL